MHSCFATAEQAVLCWPANQRPGVAWARCISTSEAVNHLQHNVVDLFVACTCAWQLYSCQNRCVCSVADSITALPLASVASLNVTLCYVDICGALQLRAALPDFKRLLQQSQFIGVSNYAR
jgi:hypothetical protein